MSEKTLEQYETEDVDSLEREFNNVMSFLLSDDNLGKFAENYRKLLNAFMDSHKNNMALVEKCRLMNAEIVQNSTKINSVMNLSQDDQRTISGLKFEFEKAWKMVELSQEKEQRSQDIISQLKEESRKLGKLAEQGANDSMNEDNSLENITNTIDILKHEIRSQQEQLDQLTKDSKEWKEKTEKLKQENESYSKEIEESTVALAETKDEAVNVENEVRGLMDQQTEIKREMIANNESIYTFIDRKKEKEELIKQLAIQKENRRQDIRDYMQQKENQLAVVEVAKKTLETKKQHNEKVVKDMAKVEAAIKEKEEELMTFDASTNEAVASIKAQEEEFNDVHKRSQNIKNDIKKARARMSQCTDEIIRLQHELFKAEAENIFVKREISLSHHVGSTTKNELINQSRNLQAEENITTNVLSDISTIKFDKHEIQLKSEEMMKAIQQHKATTTEFKSSTYTIEVFIKSTQEELSQNEIKLNDIKDQIANYKTQIKILVEQRDLTRRQIEQMKAEGESTAKANAALMNEIQNNKVVIRDKDLECIQLHKECELIKDVLPKMEKENDQIRKELKKIELDISQKSSELVRTRYFKDIAEDNLKDTATVLKSIKSQTKVSETRNNYIFNEASVLREKAEAIKWNIKCEAGQYAKIKQKVADLKAELIKLVQKKKELLTISQHRDVLFREYIQAQKTLLGYRGKVTALEEELEKPINVHRWVFLEGTNPEHLNLIKMTMSLRSRLISKLSTIERLKNDLQVAKDELEKAKKHMKEESKEDNEIKKSFYNDVLAQKDRQLKIIEQNISQQSLVVDEGKESVVEIRGTLRDTKLEYFALKKKVEEARASSQVQKVKKLLPPAKPRFMAGGFMTNTSKTSSRSTLSEGPRNRLMMPTLRSSLMACPLQSVAEQNSLPPLKPVLA